MDYHHHARRTLSGREYLAKSVVEGRQNEAPVLCLPRIADFSLQNCLRRKPTFQRLTTREACLCVSYVFLLPSLSSQACWLSLPLRNAQPHTAAAVSPATPLPHFTAPAAWRTQASPQPRIPAADIRIPQGMAATTDTAPTITARTAMAIRDIQPSAPSVGSTRAI